MASLPDSNRGGRTTAKASIGCNTRGASMNLCRTFIVYGSVLLCGWYSRQCSGGLGILTSCASLWLACPLAGPEVNFGDIVALLLRIFARPQKLPLLAEGLRLLSFLRCSARMSVAFAFLWIGAVTLSGIGHGSRYQKNAFK